MHVFNFFSTGQDRIKSGKLNVVSCILFVVVPLFSSCNSSKSKGDFSSEELQQIPVETTLDQLTHSQDTLSVLFDNSNISYFIYKGIPSGFEYELLTLFAEDHDLKLNINICEDSDHILDSLQNGRYDLAAAYLTINRSRLEKVNFSLPLYTTNQVLVQRLPQNHRRMTKDEIVESVIDDAIQLEGKVVHVRQGSSYYYRITNYSEEVNIDIDIQEVPGSYVTSKLIEMVAEGEIDYTVSDRQIAVLNNYYFQNLYLETPLSLSQHIGWAVNKKNVLLLQEINEWIEDRKGSLEYNNIYRKYFDKKLYRKTKIKNVLEFVNKGILTTIDNEIKAAAQSANWDWVLLAAQIKKESNFDIKAKSHMGALGIMQVMPVTAKKYNVSANQLFNMSQNMKLGAQEMRSYYDYWRSIVEDSVQAVKFSLASYNAGLGHVKDARRLAEKLDKDTITWDDNVEQMILLKSDAKYFNDPVVKHGYCRGIEVYGYVRKIMEYKQLYDVYLESGDTVQ